MILRSYLNKIISATLFLLSFFCLNSISFGQGLTFQQIGDSIKVEGTFKRGDTKRFFEFINTTYERKNVEKTVILNSPGGSLHEGLIMGHLFREKSFTALVKKGDRCYSACAIAFLGGTKQFMTGNDIGRILEVGAELGFHGYSFEDKQVVLLNEAFDVARAVNGLIIRYASNMKEIDLTLLSELLTVDPDNIRLVDTPREIQGLGIEIKGDLSQLPNSWPLATCTNRVDQMVPIKDPITRISNQNRPTLIKNKNELGQLLLNDLYLSDDLARPALEELSTEKFFDIIVRINPSIFPAWRFSLSRGAGFYYDYCYAVRGQSTIYTLIVSTLGGNYPIIQSHSILDGYPNNVSLW